ncbi:4-hydroxybenzoate octaprenyltransferase [Deferribacter autotrophicus]|uniref:4-hydroxybenzoate polyprenyltransferase n=1 Tax=Deferribacter autotrophicus TaxID=500465 RepID=A0A5A8F571_9BACT|nr:UbiA-like polyprenyltransferase [Deferribacter autotrophicus]KAA0257802.1 4-hydroxybenzoate octaprenyltransferase [Deferribacter autotrophicus]
MDKVLAFFRMIKIEHTIFALPFAFTGAIIAAKGLPSLDKIFWIAVAMFGARTGAMGFNRVADAEIDAKNPRTANREIPAGKIKKWEAILYIIIAFLIYEIATYKLNPLCFKLSPIPIVIFILYSYTKRFTFLCHIVLGVALGLAPMGAWVAITGNIDYRIIWLGVGVMFWVAGFDLIYAIQDIEFDREHNLFSIPRFLGVEKTIYLARFFHIIAFILFLWAKYLFDLGLVYLFGVVICGIFMIYEHKLIKPHDLSKLNMAFFNLNAYISLTIFVFTFLDIVVI